MALTYKASLSLPALVIAVFNIYLAVAAELFLQLSALIRLSLTFVPPSIALAISLTAALAAQFEIALGLGLPSLNVNLGLALEYELGIVLGLIAAIRAIASGSLCGYAYVGSGAAFGSVIDNAIAAGWPDGTLASQSVTAYLFVATTSGPNTADQVVSASIVPPAATPPTPPSPSPPPGSFPPPQGYEHGLASISFPSQVYPTVIYPSNPATGTLTIDNSVATGIGAITGITITHAGSGYPGPAMAVISDTVDIVSATVATPIVVTLPNALSIPVGGGLGVTIAGVVGSTVVSDATNASPIVITVASTTGLETCTINGAGGNAGANGQWYCQVLSPTTAALWADAAFSVPSSGTGQYTGGGTLCGNVNGLQFAKVLAGSTTVALYQDQAMSVPVVGYGTYTGGTVTGGGTGASATPSMGGGAQSGIRLFFDGLSWPSVGPALQGGVTSISAMCASTFALLAALLSNLNSRSKVLLAATAQASLSVLPPTINASITLLAKITANLQANLHVTPPSFSAAISGQISVLLDLVGRINLMLGLGLGSLQLEIWEYTGSGAGFGAAIAAGPGSTGWHDGTLPGSTVAAVVAGLTNNESASAFAAFFGGA